jgi:mono/diheme cytochrome c family protein
MTRRAVMPRLGWVALLLVPVLVAFAGGWAVITVDDLPDQVVAGEHLDLSFVVRQHGFTRMPNVMPQVVARSGGVDTRVAAVHRANGRYVATLRVPASGEWTLTIESGWGKSNVTLAPIKVVPAGTRVVASTSDFERGRRLFIAKGCVTCHVHGGVSGSGVASTGPELTDRRYAGEYLPRILASPPTTPSRPNGPTMPNLELRPVEIAALVAFINADRRVASDK